MSTLFLGVYGLFGSLFVSICIYLKCFFDDIFGCISEYNAFLASKSYSECREMLIELLEFHVKATR